MRFDAQVQEALTRAAKQVFGKHRGDPNFTGCGVGYRRRAGRLTDEPAAIAMVVNKRPRGIVSHQRLLPKSVNIDGRPCGVDVVEVGPLYLSDARAQAVTSEVSGPITGTFRPPLQGCSISNVNGGGTGTLGCMVQDASDDTFCILSTNHVLARADQAVDGELIIQPGAALDGSQIDGVAKLKRTIRLGSGQNTVDAAIAQLIDQRHVQQGVVNDLMGKISPDHPAVGMVVADDSASCSRNCFLSRMDHTLSQLGVKLLAATSDSPAVVAPEIGVAIEKVGRASGYTSSVVDATGAIIKVNWPPLGQITLSDMIWTQALHTAGDSGAVACLGGNGWTFAPLPAHCETGNCVLLDAFATYY